MRVLASCLMLAATFPLDALAQTAPAAAAQPAAGQPFNTEQLDALVAAIALYPDDLLTQLLMASTFPLEVVAAARWVEDPAHKSLSGDALVKALEAEPWDPSVKSLVPFPVVLATLNSNLTWLQQLGYAFATQQADVFAAVQRLRRLAQANDKLQSSPQQVVSTQQVTVEPPAGSSQPPDAAGGDRHPADAVGHCLRAELQSGNGVRLVVAVSILSAVLPGPAARLLFRHRAGHRAGICGRRGGRGRAVGLGESRVGRRLRERQRQPVQQHQRNRSQISSNRWAGDTGSARPGNFARAPGGPAGLPGRSQVSYRQCGAASDTRGRCGRRGGAGRPGGPGGVGGRRRPGSAGWSRWGGRWAGWRQVARAAWAVSAAPAAGGPGGVGGRQLVARWSRRRGRCRRRWSVRGRVGGAGRSRRPRRRGWGWRAGGRAAAGVPAGRASARPARSGRAAHLAI